MTRYLFDLFHSAPDPWNRRPVLLLLQRCRENSRIPRVKCQALLLRVPRQSSPEHTPPNDNQDDHGSTAPSRTDQASSSCKHQGAAKFKSRGVEEC